MPRKPTEKTDEPVTEPTDLADDVDTTTLGDAPADLADDVDTTTLGDAPSEDADAVTLGDFAPGEHAPPGYVWIKRPRSSVTLGAYNAVHDGPVLIDEKSLPELAAQGWVVVDDDA